MVESLARQTSAISCDVYELGTYELGTMSSAIEP
jgi:hypothetical protein